MNWNVNSRHAFNATYNFYDNKFLEILGNDLPQFVSDSLVRSQSFSVGETWTVSATMINEFRAGFSRLNRSRLSPNRDKNYNQEFGIAGTAADTEKAAWGVPLVNITGFSLIGDGGTLPPLGPITTYSRRHSFSFFGQDDWKLSRSLTLNLGLRFDAFGALGEKNGKEATFDPTLNGGKGGFVWSARIRSGIMRSPRTAGRRGD